ncbi:MAG TPA: hypothetical protein VJA20_00390 [Candidatus Nanoarchaeia archaeon]|nr:hypothetical protein [Candidatus Nanoarchaeia archaeon]
MKKILVFGIFLIFLVGTISATIETDYYINEKKVLVRHFLDSTSDLELRLPKDFSNLEINSEYKLEEFSKYYLIKINSTNNLYIKYITQSMIDKSKDRYSFVSRDYLNKTQNIRLVLPESAILLEDGLVFPEPDLISSDGRSVILIWEDYNEKQIVIDYEFLEEKTFIWYLIILIIILSFVLYLVFQRKIFKKKIEKIKGKNKKTNTKSEAIEEHLIESEKAVISELKKAEKNQLWQKQLQTKIGFSKAKLSRTIRNLESRNLIQKIPLGNTNKIKLKFN